MVVVDPDRPNGAQSKSVRGESKSQGLDQRDSRPFQDLPHSDLAGWRQEKTRLGYRYPLFRLTASGTSMDATASSSLRGLSMNGWQL